MSGKRDAAAGAAGDHRQLDGGRSALCGPVTLLESVTAEHYGWASKWQEATRTARAQPQVGGMANVRTNVPLSGDERADRYQFASYCIRCASLTPPHMHAHARVGRSACRFVYHCCSLRADLFQKSEGGGREKAEGAGGREGGGILMVADYAADFTRLGFHPFPTSTFHFVCARQAKKPLYPAAKDGRKESWREGGGGDCERGGPGNDSRKSARARTARSLKWGFHFHLKSGIPPDRRC